MGSIFSRTPCPECQVCENCQGQAPCPASITCEHCADVIAGDTADYIKILVNQYLAVQPRDLGAFGDNTNVNFKGSIEIPINLTGFCNTNLNILNLYGLEHVFVSALSTKMDGMGKGFNLTIDINFGTLKADISIDFVPEDKTCVGTYYGPARLLTQSILCKEGNLKLGNKENPITVKATVWIPFDCIESEKIEVSSITVKTGDIIESSCFLNMSALSNQLNLTPYLLGQVNKKIETYLKKKILSMVQKLYQQVFPVESCKRN